jgi:hypothetical protein
MGVTVSRAGIRYRPGIGEEHAAPALRRGRWRIEEDAE